MSSTQKPSQSEEEYFAQQEALARHKQAVEKARALQKHELEAKRELHWMKCPKCGFDLEALVFRGVTIDKCHHCNGSWLDAGELEQLAGAGGDVLGRIAAIFKR